MAIIREIEKTEHAILRTHAPHHVNEPILEVTDLSMRYASGDALQHITFSLPRTTQLAILGPNGAGKSTLLKIIAGVLAPSQGSVEIFGEEPGEHICIAYVPQRSQVDWNFPVSVRDVVMMGRIGKLGLLRRPKRSDWEVVEQALEVVNLTAMSRRQISELSGGQQQRMFIARALAQDAELMLMDEPFTGLDVTAQEDIFHILGRLREKRVTVLVAMHDLKLAAEYFETVLLLNHHMVGFGRPDEVFTTGNLAQAYGDHHLPADRTWLAVDDSCCGAEEDSHD